MLESWARVALAAQALAAYSASRVVMAESKLAMIPCCIAIPTCIVVMVLATENALVRLLWS